MSGSPSGADGSSEPHIRIGNDERAAALQALDEHLSAGRLEPDEYGDRVAKASVARTCEELEVLFVDLPEPHLPRGAQLAAAGPAPAPPPRRSEPSSDRDERVLGGRAGAVVVALAPIIALALFFATRWWVWFLLVPAVAVVVYGGRDHRRRGRSPTVLLGERPVVGVLHPGAMGAALGAALKPVAGQVIWAAAGRSDATGKRAELADLVAVPDVAELAARSDLVISICPPDRKSVV